MEWIPYIEIRDSATRKIIGIVEGAELQFDYNWRNCGDLDIHCRTTENNLNLLKQGRYVTIPNEIDYVDDSGNKYCNIWRINKVEKKNDAIGGSFLTATGQEAKCIIGNRIIRYMAVLKGGLISSIKNVLFAQNITNPKNPDGTLNKYRYIPEFVFNQPNFEIAITNETQVTYDNLLEYTENLYTTYNIGARLRLNLSDLKLYYSIYQGSDRSLEIVFSQANENILNTNYSEDWSNYKTYVLVGGEDEETEIKDSEGNVTGTIKGARKVNSIDDGSSGVDRYEVFVDAKDVSSKYEDNNGVEQKMNDAEYKAALKSKGKEAMLSEYNKVIAFDGEIDTTNKRYKFNNDYYLGDLVMVRDSDFREQRKVQIIKFTRVQNSEGYKEYFEHEELSTLNNEGEEEVEGALLTEYEENLLTEDDNVLLVEEVPTTYSTMSVSSTSGGVRISELPEATNINEECCLPIVSEYETKRITYGGLTERLNSDLNFASEEKVENVRTDLLEEIASTNQNVASNTSAISNINNTLSTKANLSEVNAINEKIPTQASATNQLADKEFVNSSVSTATATFRGTVNNISELPTTGIDINDYAFVKTTDSAGNTLYQRYKYDGSAWAFEYELNNSSFTSEQWVTINSGLTKEYVDNINTVLTDGVRDEKQARISADKEINNEITTIKSSLSNKASQADLNTTNANVSQNTTDIVSLKTDKADVSYVNEIRDDLQDQITTATGGEYTKVLVGGVYQPTFDADTKVNQTDFENVIKNTTVIGDSTKGLRIGESSTVKDSSATAIGHLAFADGECSTAIGSWATADSGDYGGDTLGEYSTAIGEFANANQHSVAVGKGSNAYQDSVAIGYNAVAASETIGDITEPAKIAQIGEGTNRTPNTVQFFGDNVYNHSTHTMTVQNISLNGEDLKTKIDAKASKSELFSGSYNDLTDKPTIPTNYVTTDTTQTVLGDKTFTGIIIVPDVTIS